MNITNLANITNITNQVTTATPQAGFRCDPSAMLIDPKGGERDSAPLLKLDLSGRQGWRGDYSIQDAAASLWRQETQTFNLQDLNDPAKADKIIENMRLGAAGASREEALTAYVQDLRQNGLSGEVDWRGLARELAAFKTTSPEELAEGLDYLASRYVAALDKLERNYQGEELTAQRAKLAEVYQTGQEGLIEGYTQLLQDNLGIAGADAQGIKDSLAAILAAKVEAYQGALVKVQQGVAQTGPDSGWLQNHDAYIAAQLRGVAGSAAGSGSNGAMYSVQDLTAAGQIAQSYRTELFNAASGGRNEATLALNLAMADMKGETMLQKGLLSQNMAALLRNSRPQGQAKALAALDQALAQRENSRASGESQGTYAPVDSSVFQGIYKAVINAYQQNGGDGAAAIRAGAALGQSITAQATAQNPNALRWGISMQSYWQDFYTAPSGQAASPLAKQVNKLLAQTGQTSNIGCSTYQKYVNSWQDFLTAIGGGLDSRA